MAARRLLTASILYLPLLFALTVAFGAGSKTEPCAARPLVSGRRAGLKSCAQSGAGSVLWLGTAEHVSAIVEMNHPGDPLTICLAGKSDVDTGSLTHSFVLG